MRAYAHTFSEKYLCTIGRIRVSCFEKRYSESRAEKRDQSGEWPFIVENVQMAIRDTILYADFNLTFITALCLEGQSKLILITSPIISKNKNLCRNCEGTPKQEKSISLRFPTINTACMTDNGKPIFIFHFYSQFRQFPITCLSKSLKSTLDSFITVILSWLHVFDNKSQYIIIRCQKESVSDVNFKVTAAWEIARDRKKSVRKLNLSNHLL